MAEALEALDQRNESPVSPQSRVWGEPLCPILRMLRILREMFLDAHLLSHSSLHQFGELRFSDSVVPHG